jgi:serine/threonine-protein kinase RsbW
VSVQTLRVPWKMSSAVEVRRTLVSRLRALGVDPVVVDESEIVVSELVANAFRHAKALPDGTIGVNWTVSAGVVEIEVTDGGGPTTPEPAPRSVWSPNGRGLRIVGTLAYEWGVQEDRIGSTVWASMGGPSRRHLR